MWVSSRILNPDLSRPQITIFPLWINTNFVFQIALSSNPETHPLLSLTFHIEDISKPYLRYLHHTVLSHLSAACLSKNCFSPELLQRPTNWFAYFFHCSFPNPPHNAIPCHGSVQNLPKSLLKRKKKISHFLIWIAYKVLQNLWWSATYCSDTHSLTFNSLPHMLLISNQHQSPVHQFGSSDYPN